MARSSFPFIQVHPSTFMYLTIILLLLSSYNIQMNAEYLLRCRVFNKGRQPASFAGYFTLTHCLIDWEITSYFTTNMRNTCHKTRALDGTRFIREKQKNLAWILNNFSSDLCFLFKCPNSCSRMQEMHSKRPKFSKFSAGAHPRPSYPLVRVVHSPPTFSTPKILPPAQVPIGSKDPVGDVLF